MFLVKVKMQNLITKTSTSWLLQKDMYCPPIEVECRFNSDYKPTLIDNVVIFGRNRNDQGLIFL